MENIETTIEEVESEVKAKRFVWVLLPTTSFGKSLTKQRLRMNKHGKDGGWALHALHRLESSMGLIVYSDNMYAWRLKPSSTTSDLPYSSFVILYLPIFPTHESFFGEVKNSQVLLTIWICTYSYLFTKRININKYYFFGILQKEYSWFPFSKKRNIHDFRFPEKKFKIPLFFCQKEIQNCQK